MKQLRKSVSDTIIWVLQRSAKAEGMGDQSVLRRPQRALLCYHSPLFFDTLEILFQRLDDLKELLE